MCIEAHWSLTSLRWKTREPIATEITFQTIPHTNKEGKKKAKNHLLKKQIYIHTYITWNTTVVYKVFYFMLSATFL
jgi:hypothetical protein